MKTIEIKGHLREAVGSKSAKDLRREGHVPCVVYGGESNLHFHADIRELNKLIFTPDVYLVNLNLDGNTTQAVVREAQYHPVKDQLIHMDFVAVVPNKPVSLSLPVILEGNPIGVRNGGVLRRNAKKLYVKGMVNDIPDAININIESMKIGDSKKAGDISFAGLEILESANRVVVAVKTSRKAIVTEEEEAEGEAGEEGTEETAAAEGAAENAETPAEG